MHIDLPIQQPKKQYTTLKNSLFVPQKDSSKGEWIASIISNSVTAIDAFLLIRKLTKNYGFLFGHKKKK